MTPLSPHHGSSHPFQSTHPRRVWLSDCFYPPIMISFNPHTHEGCDLEDYCAKHNLKFQSTHPRRVWLYINWANKRANVFQSTHPRRVWPIGCKLEIRVLEFQSTHPRRVWHLFRVAFLFHLCVSIHTPTKGVTQHWQYRPKCDNRFNPHTHEGCDFTIFHDLAVWGVSIHTPTKGVTSEIGKAITRIAFQSTHPRRVWLYVLCSK